MPSVAEMLQTPKQVLRWGGLQPRTNHAGHLIGVAELANLQGVTLPGYTLQIEVKSPAVVDRCLHLFSIMRLHARKRFPVYQLEVAPHDKRTHNAIPPIYGPHAHMLDSAPIAVGDPRVDCRKWRDSLQWFFEQTRITPFEIDDPNRDVQL